MEVGEPISQTGEPVTFRWDGTESVGLVDDLQRYEQELLTLLDSEDSAWARTEVVRSDCFPPCHPAAPASGV
jgi:hypothetical protein